jgi:hypothetical protein
VAATMFRAAETVFRAAKTVFRAAKNGSVCFSFLSA